MKLAVLCPSEIAYRRFMPAFSKTSNKFVGIAVNSIEERYGENIPDDALVDAMIATENEKADKFVELYGGVKYHSYESLIESSDVEAIYIPLPPGLHFKWAKKALLAGKHVLLEKPSTLTSEDTIELVKIATHNQLALHENYMFNFHAQLDAINDILNTKQIGDIRLYRISFGFPKRDKNDFRYVKSLGGGALIDAGGYCIKYATRLLGNKAKIAYSRLNYIDGFEVDMYGSGALVNDKGQTVQIAFGMDNDYKCELEVWGSTGTFRTGRVLTAPDGFVPSYTISHNGVLTTSELPSDDSFEKSIRHFFNCVDDPNLRNENYEQLVYQSKLVDEFFKLS